jgi:hypothetical protein
MPTLTARVRVSFDEPAQSAEARTYAIRGSIDEMRAEIQKWADLDVEQLTIWVAAESSEAQIAAIERFVNDVKD